MGAHRKTLPVEITADVFARAIIAAAASYGDDPLVAFSGRLGDAGRRALTAAASGIYEATRAPFPRLAAILGLSAKACANRRAPSLRNEGFTRAELAAERAVRYALWRPEAAESVVAGDVPTDEELLNGPGVAAPTGILRGEVVAEGLVGGGVLAPDPLAGLGSDGVEAFAPDAGVELPPPSITVRHDPAATIDANGVRHLAPPPLELATRAPRAVPPPARPDLLTEQPIDEQLLEALVDGEARNSMSLAAVIDRKEMAVVSALGRLEARGAVLSEACENGPRRFVWRLAPGIAEAAE